MTQIIEAKTDISIAQIGAIIEAMDGARFATFAFPDGRRHRMNISSRTADDALNALLRNIDRQPTLDCAIRETAFEVDAMPGMRSPVLSKLVDLIGLIEETSKASAPDPAITVTLH